MLEELHMITIALVILGAYLGITLVFVLGLAAAASRPVPSANVVEVPAAATADGDSCLEEAA